MAMNFSFIIPERLAGMEYPGTWATLEDDLRFLTQEGVRGIVTLTEDPLDRPTLERHGFAIMHLPVRDFMPPTLEQIGAFIHFVDETDGAVVVHCRAGMGRTGTMLACYLVAADGITAEEAIRRVRLLRPHSIETTEQEDVVRRYALSRQRKEAGL